MAPDDTHPPESFPAWSAPWPSWVLLSWFLGGWLGVPLILQTLNYQALNYAAVWPMVLYWIATTCLMTRWYGVQPTLITLGLLPEEGMSFHWRSLAHWVGLLIVYAGLMLLLGVLFTWLMPNWFGITAHFKTTTLTSHQAFQAIWINPWLEEFVFRGLLLGSFLPSALRTPPMPLLLKLKGVIRPLIIITLFFTLCHSQYTTSAGALMYVSTQAFLLAMARVHTGSLAAPILLHTLNNAVSLY